MVGEGMTALCVNELVTEKETELAVKLCDTFGKTEVIPEHLMDAVVGVSGSSPAYVFMFLEAMADAAVQTECREHRHTNLRHSPCSEVQN